MKIGIVTEYFYPTLGGITENVYHSSKEFLKMGHDVKIITGRFKNPTELEDEIRDKIIYIGKSIPTFFNGSCGRVTVGCNLSKKMRSVLKREKFDIIHVHSPLFPTLPMIANKESDAPTVGTFHTIMTETFYYKMYRKVLQRTLKKMSGRIAVSKCCAEENKKYFDFDFDVIPNGVSVEEWRSALPLNKFDDGKINILFVGRPDTRNGLDKVIDAFAIAYEKRKNIRLIIVGDGPLLFYFKHLVPREIKHVVEFEGAANKTRPNYLASADIFAFTPSIASFGITILEGMSAGKAIVASNIPAFSELVTNDESALLINPNDARDIANAFVRLTDDEVLRKKLGINAASHVEKYDWKKVAEKQIEYYKKIIETQDARL